MTTSKKDKHLEGLALIREVSLMIGTGNNLDSVFDQVLAACIRFSNAGAGAILMMDANKKELKIAKHRGFEEEVAKDFRLKLGHGVAGYVAKTGRTMLVPDVEIKPRYVPYRKKVRSILAVPIFDLGKTVGVISVDSNQRNAFKPEDVQVLETVAALADNAIRNAQTHDEREQRIHELDILNRINHIFSTTLNLKRVFNEVVAVLKKEMKMQRAALVLLNTETGELEIKIADGFTEDQMKRRPLPLGRGHHRQGRAHGQDHRRARHFAGAQFLDRTGARTGLKVTRTLSFMCVPIKLEEQVIGVLSLDKEFEGDEQFKRDLQFLDIVSGSLAQAVRIHMMADEVRQELEDRNLYLKNQLSRKFSFANIIGQSEPMQEVFQRIQMVAKSKATVLIRGDSGTGKELVAKAIHFNSPLKEKNFVKVNCATIPETLLESELFGHMRGSFTGAIADKKGKFEVADGGTIFLDEIGEISTTLQAKLLRVLQERVIEPDRVEPAQGHLGAGARGHQQGPGRNMTEGKFREDLYYRLNVVPIFIPPLRSRKQDIPYLVDYFLERFNKENSKQIKLSPELIAEFMAYDWPGNVRELKNLIERMVIMSQAEVIEPGMVSFQRKLSEPGIVGDVSTAPPKPTKPLAEMEKDAVLKALKQTDGVQVESRQNPRRNSPPDSIQDA